MIGRSALADPWLARRISRELGIESAAATLPDPRDLAAWLPLLRRFVVLSARYSDRDTADGKYCTRRVKQWLRYSETTWKTPWFSRVKRTESLPELFAALDEAVTFRPLATDRCENDRPVGLESVG
jgi:hypothetical protein